MAPWINWQVSLIPVELERSEPVWTAAWSLTSIQTVQTDSQPPTADVISLIGPQTAD